MLTVLRFDDPLRSRPKRVLVAGVSGAGKTSLAARVAVIAGAPHTEIDSLYHGPGWIPRQDFLRDVRVLSDAETWTTEWQYSSVRPLLASRADLLVWLDLSFVRVVLPRVVGRTLKRRLRREHLWNGNVEPPLRTFFTDREHIVRWAIATRNKYEALTAQVHVDHPQLDIVRLRTPREVDVWLSGPLAQAVRGVGT